MFSVIQNMSGFTLLTWAIAAGLLAGGVFAARLANTPASSGVELFSAVFFFAVYGVISLRVLGNLSEQPERETPARTAIESHEDKLRLMRIEAKVDRLIEQGVAVPIIEPPPTPAKRRAKGSPQLDAAIAHLKKHRGDLGTPNRALAEQLGVSRQTVVRAKQIVSEDN
jgi:hypothetical protein